MRTPSGLLLGLALGTALGQPRPAGTDDLAEVHHKQGAATLGAFAPVAEAARGSVVQFDQGGERVALGTVIDGGGWVLTKASEIQGDNLKCRLPDGSTVGARLVKTDDDNDLALVRVEAQGLRPVRWAVAEPAVGQWTVSPGLNAVAEAVGIVSGSPRRIPHRRALIGIVLDLTRRDPRIAELMAGMGAERAGLKVGDVIVGLNDSPVESREELVQALREFREGQAVQVRVQRDDAERQVEVTLGVPKPEANGRSPDRAERMNRMGSELSVRADGFRRVLVHDTVLQAWQCGGPLLNLDGEAIGLNIARAGRVASYALPAEVVREITAGMLHPSPPPAETGRRNGG
jgi:serine protease Do